MQSLPTGTVTLLFIDIAGSTRLLTQLGDRYTHVLWECRQVLRTAFGQWNGHVVDTQGDAFFVVFARASDAGSAAVAAQHALISHAFPDDAVVQVRMGLHTGEPQRTAEGYVGLDVHRAARIMNAGHGDRFCSPGRPVRSWSKTCRRGCPCVIWGSIASRTWNAPCTSSSS